MDKIWEGWARVSPTVCKTAIQFVEVQIPLLPTNSVSDAGVA